VNAPDEEQWNQAEEWKANREPAPTCDERANQGQERKPDRKSDETFSPHVLCVLKRTDPVAKGFVKKQCRQRCQNSGRAKCEGDWIEPLHAQRPDIGNPKLFNVGEESAAKISPQPTVNNSVAAKKWRPDSDGEDLEFSLSVSLVFPHRRARSATTQSLQRL